MHYLTRKAGENHRPLRSAHTIMSSGSKNASKHFRRKQQRLPLDYNKYLIGRSYQLFKGALRSDKTLQLYKQHLFHFCDFIKMTTETFAETFLLESLLKTMKKL